MVDSGEEVLVVTFMAAAAAAADILVEGEVLILATEVVVALSTLVLRKSMNPVSTKATAR